MKAFGNGARVIDQFMFLLADHYYRLVHDAIRLYDKNHLIMGDRYPSWYNQSVVRAAIPYVDVISTNYMADWNDGNFSRFYLDSLYRLTKKPIIVTEYYAAARENRSGNKNSGNMFPIVKTQTERAEAFRTNLTNLAKTPYVIGAHWFQLYDEPTNGRSLDGEDYNFGLIDIHNKPYEELTAAAKSLNTLEIHAESAALPKNDLIPLARSAAENGLGEWDKMRSFIEPDFIFPDKCLLPIYASWDAEFLYLAVYAMDYTDSKFYQNGLIPDSERMTFTLFSTEKDSAVKMLFGNELPAKTEGDEVEFKTFHKSTRYTVLLKLPAAKFKRKSFRKGDTITVNANLSSHSRAEVMAWKQTLVLGD